MLEIRVTDDYTKLIFMFSLIGGLHLLNKIVTDTVTGNNIIA
jgi:hypothetical protein